MKSLFLLAAILLGACIPQASIFSPAIYYLLMVMLFFPFLQWKISFAIFKEKRVYYVLLLNILIGLVGYFSLHYYNQNLAFIALLIGLTPTATASPAVIGFLKGRIDFAIAAVLITNIFMAIFLPFVIYQISDIHIAMSSMIIQMIGVIFIPLIAGQLLQYISPKLQHILCQFGNTGFYLWLIVCFLAISKASSFIQKSNIPLQEILLIGSLAALICILNFSLGRIFGGKQLSLEMSQTLGQKNTTLTIWVGLSYFNPLIALGPIFYLVCHNLYNSYQLAVQEKR